MKEETYVSTDVETDGPIPGPHSMLSLASAAFSEAGALLSTFSANLATLDGASPHPETLKWWRGFPDAWAACRENPRPPAETMQAYAAWVEALPGNPVFVGYPAAWDFMFVYWYLMRFVGRSPFSHAALDVKSYASALLNLPFRETVKARMPRRWFPARPHTHVALDDALEQGALFCGMLKDRSLVQAERRSRRLNSAGIPPSCDTPHGRKERKIS